MMERDFITLYIYGHAPQMNSMSVNHNTPQNNTMQQSFDQRIEAMKEQTIGEQIRGLGRLKPYLWPKGNLGFKIRSILALLLTVLGKFVLVGAPFIFGWAIDAVNNAQSNGQSWSAVLVGVSGFIIGYGALRLLSVILTEGREYIFAPVAQFAQRSVATGTFSHMHRLSLRFHLDKRTGGLTRIIERGVEIKQALTDLEKMFVLMGLKPEIIDHPDARDIHDVKGHIAFDNVIFNYDDDRTILDDISFDIQPGQTVAVVGPTGAGKSTLSRILFRFYDIRGGQVTIDTLDISNIKQASLREVIGIVPQDTVLFNDTIAYNIKYANPKASQEVIEKAAKDAQIHDFILTLPKGYDTMVGERGLKLSGGEKQRVAIARTLVKDPAILILDEATSALDSSTEREIQDALDRVSKGRTTLVIAHRLSTIVNADKILVLEDGKIKEQGTHSALLEKEGLYATLWAQQD